MAFFYLAYTTRLDYIKTELKNKIMLFTSKELREALGVTRTRLHQLIKTELSIGKDYKKIRDNCFEYKSSALAKLLKRQTKNKKYNHSTKRLDTK